MWNDLKLDPNNLPPEDTDVIVLIRKFGRGPGGYKRLGWVCSETHQWRIYCEFGEHYFDESTASQVDHYIITHWCYTPEDPL